MARPVPPLRPIILAAFHGVSFFHFEFGEMKVEGEQSLAVVDHYALPSKYRKRASRTVPAFMAATGVPVGTRKSSPWCSRCALPLKMRCEPKTSEIAASAGAANLPSHSRSGVTRLR